MEVCNSLLGRKPNIYEKDFWLGVSPAIVTLVSIANFAMYKKPEYVPGEHYPDWALSLGWCIALVPMMWTPGWFLILYYFCKYGGYDILRINMMPLASWGPANNEHRFSGTQPTILVTSRA